MKHRHSHDIPTWISVGPETDYADRKPRRRLFLFGPAPQWLVFGLTWFLVFIATGGFWWLFLTQLEKSL